MRTALAVVLVLATAGAAWFVWSGKGAHEPCPSDRQIREIATAACDAEADLGKPIIGCFERYSLALHNEFVNHELPEHNYLLLGRK